MVTPLTFIRDADSSLERPSPEKKTDKTYEKIKGNREPQKLKTDNKEYMYFGV
jgi:hypothetical protein